VGKDAFVAGAPVGTRTEEAEASPVIVLFGQLYFCRPSPPSSELDSQLCRHRSIRPTVTGEAIIEVHPSNRNHTPNP
jgi:hypothetical protein